MKAAETHHANVSVLVALASTFLIASCKSTEKDIPVETIAEIAAFRRIYYPSAMSIKMPSGLQIIGGRKIISN